MVRTKSNTLNSTKHAEQQDETDIQNKHFCVLGIFHFLCYIFDFLKWNLQEMLSYRLGTVNDFKSYIRKMYKYNNI